MIDYRIINAAAGLFGFLAFLLYWRSGEYKNFRHLMRWIGLLLLYYAIIYSAAVVLDWPTAQVSTWLRPPFAVVETSFGVLMLVMAWPYVVTLINRFRKWVRR